MPYAYLYFAFDESGEFDDEVYSVGDIETDEEMQKILKDRSKIFLFFISLITFENDSAIWLHESF